MRYGSGRAGPHALDGGTQGTTSWGHKLGAQAGDTSGVPRGTTMRYGPGRAGPHALARRIIEIPPIAFAVGGWLNIKMKLTNCCLRV